MASFAGKGNHKTKNERKCDRAYLYKPRIKRNNSEETFTDENTFTGGKGKERRRKRGDKKVGHFGIEEFSVVFLCLQQSCFCFCFCARSSEERSKRCKQLVIVIDCTEEDCRAGQTGTQCKVKVARANARDTACPEFPERKRKRNEK